MAWYISNAEKKNVTETETWTKDGETLKHETGWRWGKWRTETKPDLSNYDEDEGCDPCDMFDAEMDSTDDGCWEDWTYPLSWDDAAIEAFEELWEAEWHDAPLQMGFTEDDNIMWIRGPLDIAEIADSDDEDEQWEGQYEEPELSAEEEARLDAVAKAFLDKESVPVLNKAQQAELESEMARLGTDLTPEAREHLAKALANTIRRNHANDIHEDEDH